MLQVCVKIENPGGDAPKMFGRHFDETDMLISRVSICMTDSLAPPCNMSSCRLAESLLMLARTTSGMSWPSQTGLSWWSSRSSLKSCEHQDYTTSLGLNKVHELIFWMDFMSYYLM